MRRRRRKKKMRTGPGRLTRKIRKRRRVELRRATIESSKS